MYIDGFFEEPAAVAKLFDLKVVQHVPISSKNARISQVCGMTLGFDASIFLHEVICISQTCVIMIQKSNM